MNKKEDISWIWLSSLEKVIPKKKFQLIKHFKNANNVWEASSKELASLKFVTSSMMKQLTDTNLREESYKYPDMIKSKKIKMLTINDDDYPFYLRNIFDPPIVLYIKGTLRKKENSIAIIGARQATPYGCNMSRVLARELSHRGFTIVSGMARGIDSWAHQGAIDAKGRTIAVLGCGVDIVYPPENEEMAGKIINNGAVISEFLPEKPPIPINFPSRNRIISGLSIGTVVIEAGEKSGSLITANYALDQGREVFALPSNVSSPVSLGTNRLIRDGAKIITGIEDILEELKVYIGDSNNVNSNLNFSNERALYGLTLEERKLAKFLLNDMLHIDELAKRSGLNVQTVSSILTLLELKGVVEHIPGKIYRIRN